MYNENNKSAVFPNSYKEKLSDTRYAAQMEGFISAPLTLCALPDYVIAIPAMNEENYIIHCLDACKIAMDNCDRVGRILLLVNNSNDDTVKNASQWANEKRAALDILVVSFPKTKASAGNARGLALEIASSIVNPAGVLLTTDADSLPDKSWVHNNLARLDKTAGIVCGNIDFYDDDKITYVPEFATRLKNEELYHRLSGALLALHDPDPFNPWPHHWHQSGANIALSNSAFEKIGGAPHVHLGEDRALVEQACLHDIPVIYCSRSFVRTSIRLKGRAHGGMADTMTARIESGDFLCDERLEPAHSTLKRAQLRSAVRDLFAHERDMHPLLIQLGLKNETLEMAESLRRFGRLWHFLEQTCPELQRKRILASQLPTEIAQMHHFIAHAKGQPQSQKRQIMTTMINRLPRAFKPNPLSA